MSISLRGNHKTHMKQIRPSRAGDVFELQCRKLGGKREARRYSDCLKPFPSLSLDAEDPGLDRARRLFVCMNGPQEIVHN